MIIYNEKNGKKEGRIIIVSKSQSHICKKQLKLFCSCGLDLFCTSFIDGCNLLVLYLFKDSRLTLEVLPSGRDVGDNGGDIAEEGGETEQAHQQLKYHIDQLHLNTLYQW